MAEAYATAFERLVSEHQLTVLRLCRCVLRDEHLGSDAAQEVFIKLWEQVRRGSSPSHPSGWLKRVAVTTSVDLARRRQVRDASHAHIRAQIRSDASVKSKSSRSDTAASELERALDEALVYLSEGQRVVFQLRHFGELPLSEIAAVLGVAVPTVKTQFARACLKLQARLKGHSPRGGRER